MHLLCDLLYKYRTFGSYYVSLSIYTCTCINYIIDMQQIIYIKLSIDIPYVNTFYIYDQMHHKQVY